MMCSYVAIAENPNRVCYVANGITESDAKQNCIKLVLEKERLNEKTYKKSKFTISVIKTDGGYNAKF